MVKFADEIYLVVPASNCESCAEVIKHIGDWASSNNLSLNNVKLLEIVYVSPRYQRFRPFQGLKKSKRFYVTIRKFLHIDHLRVFYVQSLFPLHTLWHHGLPIDSLHTTCRSYVSSASLVFASAADRVCLNLFSGGQQLWASVRPLFQYWAFRGWQQSLQ